MGRGETPETCEFEREEMTSLKNLLRSMLTYEPSECISADEAMGSDYMVRWTHPALMKSSQPWEETKSWYPHTSSSSPRGKFWYEKGLA